MAAALMLSTDSAQNWTLPDDTDTVELAARIQSAMKTQNVIRVRVVIPGSSKQQDELILNFRTLPMAAIIESGATSASSPLDPQQHRGQRKSPSW